MNYSSTRTGFSVTAAEAIAKGLAPNGGLFVPDVLPQLTEEDLRAISAMQYRERAVFIMRLFLPEFSEEELSEFAAGAYGAQFDDARIAPVHALDDATSFLELWHGPTCAFKDMALQMLPYLLTASLKKNGEQRRVCILVATSGDTGKAALQGFADVPGTKILVFYPDGGVSDVQRLQMVTQTGTNVSVCAVKGNFDDAQTGVKQIFGDAELAGQLSERGWFLSSANSINWGRLLCVRVCGRGRGRPYPVRREDQFRCPDRQLRQYSGRLVCKAHGSSRGNTRLRFQRKQRAVRFLPYRRL